MGSKERGDDFRVTRRVPIIGTWLMRHFGCNSQNE